MKLNYIDTINNFDNITDLYDIGTSEDTYRLVIDYLGGGNGREISNGAYIELTGYEIPQNLKDYFSDNLDQFTNDFEIVGNGTKEFISGFDWGSFYTTQDILKEVCKRLD